MTLPSRLLVVITMAAATLGPARLAWPEEPMPAAVRVADCVAADLQQRCAEALSDGLAFLAATQRPDGSWPQAGRSDPAITALVARAFVQQPEYGPDHPVARRAIDFVLRYRQPDGGIYIPEFGLHNYYTCVCLSLLAAAERPAHEQIIRDAQEYLKKIQWDETEDIDHMNAWYGGGGYGRHKRPDLSNTQMMIEALKESGLPPDDPTYKKAMQFVQRCQMNSQSNDQPFARGQDGGFIYTPAQGGESKAGYIVREDRKMLRSYGNMTYAGFKSMLYAGVDRDDPRVRAALDWIRNNYTVTHNANMPDQRRLEGYYYYVHVFAKALRAWGEPVIADADGVTHNWREDLCRVLLSKQARDGSWVNEADRWYEGNPHLVTAYALLALQEALGDC